MRPARSAYLVGALAMAGARTVGVAAGFASLWLLSQILAKDMLGGYAFAFNVVLLASNLATLGLERSLLLRIAAEPGDGRTLGGGRLALETLLLVTAAAALVSLCRALTADSVARLGAIGRGRSGSARWPGPSSPSR
jgi:O-antigen/teichoic acid export membrane protein